MTLGIVGSRTFDDYKLLEDTIINHFCSYDIDNGWVPDFNKFISGGAKGADSLGRLYCEKYSNIEIVEFLPDWKSWGKSAGFRRNEEIIKNVDVLLAFWDSVSKGTQHSLGLAKKYKKPTFIVYF